MNALSQMIEAAAPAGVILDLQVLRPDPFVELDGEVVARIDGEELFACADTATAAIDARIAAGDLIGGGRRPPRCAQALLRRRRPGRGRRGIETAVTG